LNVTSNGAAEEAAGFILFLLSNSTLTYRKAYRKRKKTIKLRIINILFGQELPRGDFVGDFFFNHNDEV
jgi:hypothetical protein